MRIKRGIRQQLLAASLGVSLLQPFALGAVGSILLGAAAGEVRAQQTLNTEAIGRIAQAITVRIEGATQGSGVLVKREGNRYTVLTAWHVVSGQRPGEELNIYTPDGQRHLLEQGSVKRIGEVDMALLSFSSPSSYELARIGDVKRLSSGEHVFVAGFTNWSNGKLKFHNGKLVANAAIGIDQGYQLLYTNVTASGMSGGAVLKADGTVIGMHGRGELDEQKSLQHGLIVKTGTNQGVPISYFSLYDAGLPVKAFSTQATTADDYLAQAMALLSNKKSDHEIIIIATQALAIRKSADAYFYRAYAKQRLGDIQGALSDYNLSVNLLDRDTNAEQAIYAYLNRGSVRYALKQISEAISDWTYVISIDPKNANAYFNRGGAMAELNNIEASISDLDRAISLSPADSDALRLRGTMRFATGDIREAIADYSEAISINPKDELAYLNRGIAKSRTGDNYEAIDDFNKALALDSRLAKAYVNRGNSYLLLGNTQMAVADYNMAITIDEDYPDSWGARGLARARLGDRAGGCEDIRKAASLGSKQARRILPQMCQ